MHKQTFIITKEFMPGVFDKTPHIKVGDKAVQVDRDTYMIVEKTTEREKGTVSTDFIKKLGKRSLPAGGITLAQHIGSQIRKARQYRGWSLEELGGKVRATRQYISGLETGQSCSFEKLQHICDVLNFDLKIKITRRYENQDKDATAQVSDTKE